MASKEEITKIISFWCLKTHENEELLPDSLVKFIQTLSICFMFDIFSKKCKFTHFQKYSTVHFTPPRKKKDSNSGLIWHKNPISLSQNQCTIPFKS